MKSFIPILMLMLAGCSSQPSESEARQHILDAIGNCSLARITSFEIDNIISTINPNALMVKIRYVVTAEKSQALAEAAKQFEAQYIREGKLIDAEYSKEDALHKKLTANYHHICRSSSWASAECKSVETLLIRQTEKVNEIGRLQKDMREASIKRHTSIEAFKNVPAECMETSSFMRTDFTEKVSKSFEESFLMFKSKRGWVRW